MELIDDMVAFLTGFIYYIIPISAAVIVIVKQKKNRDRRKRIASEIICLSSPDSFKLVFAFMITSFFLIVLTKFFIPSFVMVIEIAIPEYFNRWYQLLWVINIKSLSYRFLVNDMLIDATALIVYNEALVFFIISSSSLFIIPYFIYQGIQRSMICKRGVLVTTKLIRWEDFQCAEWEGPIEKNNKIYFYLWLYIRDPKRPRKWDDPFSTLKLKVRAEDREAINSLIKANSFTL